MSSHHSLIRCLANNEIHLLIKQVLTRVHQEGQRGAEVVSQLRRSGVTHLGVQTTLNNNVSDSNNIKFVFIHQ